MGRGHNRSKAETRTLAKEVGTAQTVQGETDQVLLQRDTKGKLSGPEIVELAEIQSAFMMEGRLS